MEPTINSEVSSVIQQGGTINKMNASFWWSWLAVNILYLSILLIISPSLYSDILIKQYGPNQNINPIFVGLIYLNFFALTIRFVLTSKIIAQFLPDLMRKLFVINFSLYLISVFGPLIEYFGNRSLFNISIILWPVAVIMTIISIITFFVLSVRDFLETKQLKLFLVSLIFSIFFIFVATLTGFFDLSAIPVGFLGGHN